MMPPLAVNATPTVVEQPPSKPALPNPADLHNVPVKWLLITPDRLPKGKNWVYYALTPQQYEIMSRNEADTIRWVGEARWRLDYYRGTGERSNGLGTEGTTGKD